MRPKVQITRFPANPSRVLCVSSGQKLRGNFGHDHQTLTVGRDLSDHAARLRRRLGHQSVKGGDDGLVTSAHEIQYVASPVARIKSKFMLQANHVARPVVGRLSGHQIGVGTGIIDDMNNPRIPIVVRHGLLDRRNRRVVCAG
jgi:hypothetical protein